MAGFWSKVGKFFTGSPGKVHQVSNLRKDQEELSEQLVNAGKGQGAGGAFGSAADYYRDLLSEDPQALQAYMGPALRQYNEEIVPDLSEQFAGMGSGGLSSSGFRNAQIQGATDLSERIGQIRANLKQQGAAGLANIGQLGLQSFQSNYEQPGTPGIFEQVAPAVGNAITQGVGNWWNSPSSSNVPNATSGTGVGTPQAGVGLGNPTASKWYGGNAVGKNTSPYGGTPKASPNIQQRNNFNLPNFMNGQGGY